MKNSIVLSWDDEVCIRLSGGIWNYLQRQIDQHVLETGQQPDAIKLSPQMYRYAVSQLAGEDRWRYSAADRYVGRHHLSFSGVPIVRSLTDA